MPRRVIEPLLVGTRCDKQVVEVLQRIRREAEETDERCSEVIDGREGKKTAILGKLNEKAGEDEVKLASEEDPTS